LTSIKKPQVAQKRADAKKIGHDRLPLMHVNLWPEPAGYLAAIDGKVPDGEELDYRA
jgi:hypothetical protein